VDKRLAFKFILTIGFLAGISSALSGQERYTDGLYWLGFKVKTEFGDKWSASLEFEERRFMFPDRAHQRTLPDVSVFYHFSPEWKTGLSYTNFSIRSPGTADLPISSILSEQRYSLFLAKSFKLSQKDGMYTQWKTELRNFDRDPNDGELNYLDYLIRLRFLFRYSYTLENNWKLNCGDELHLHTAGNSDHQLFDQNRIFAGISKSISDWNCALGYIFWYQKNRKGSAIFSRHILRFTCTYTLSFR